MVQARLGEHVEHAARRPRLRVGRAVDDARHAREHDRAGAHRARLERHVEHGVEQPPAAAPLRGRPAARASRRARSGPGGARARCARRPPPRPRGRPPRRRERRRDRAPCGPPRSRSRIQSSSITPLLSEARRGCGATSSRRECSLGALHLNLPPPPAPSALLAGLVAGVLVLAPGAQAAGSRAQRAHRERLRPERGDRPLRAVRDRARSAPPRSARPAPGSRTSSPRARACSRSATARASRRRSPSSSAGPACSARRRT